MFRELVKHLMWVGPLLLFVGGSVLVVTVYINPIWVAVLGAALIGVASFLCPKWGGIRSKSPGVGYRRLAGMILLSILAMLPVLWFGSIVHYVDAGRKKLIYETNHEVVLSAARMVMSDPGKFGLSEGNPRISSDGVRLPQAIAELKPNYIWFDGERLCIPFGGGMDHWGLYAFPAGVEGYGNLKLISGLWFWEDEKSPRLHYPSGYREFRHAVPLSLPKTSSLRQGSLGKGEANDIDR
jgi:hypothetical protein